MNRPHLTELIEQARPVVSSTSLHVDRETILRCLHQDEAGDAQLLVALMQNTLCFDKGSDAWYCFKGHHWSPLHIIPYNFVTGDVASEYLALASMLQAEAGKTAIKSEQKRLKSQIDALTKRADRLWTLARSRNVLHLAKELVAIDGSQWDSDPWLLGVANGVVDLRSGTIRAGLPHDYIRKIAPTEWKGINASCPRWEHFVGEIMSHEAERVQFLQRLLGYSINGTTEEHVLVILVGSRGRNGKRVLCENVRAVLGPYAYVASTDIVIGQERRTPGSAQPHLMDLQGRRFVIASETGEYARLSTAQVKNITGGDLITARRLHANPVTFAPTHTIFLQTNHKPQAPADDDALWERVKVIEFTVRFVDEPHDPDERPRDPTLEPDLRGEASGILAWLVRGHQAYLKCGLQTPDSVRLARDTYRRSESIDAFVEACCVEADRATAEGGALYEAYKAWCEFEQLKPKPINWFGGQLRQRYEKGRVPGEGRSCYFGISIEYNLRIATHLAEYRAKRMAKQQTEVEATVTREDPATFSRSSNGFSDSRVEKPKRPSQPSRILKNSELPDQDKSRLDQPPSLTHKFYAAYRAGDKQTAAAIIADHPDIDWTDERQLLTAQDFQTNDRTSSRFS